MNSHIKGPIASSRQGAIVSQHRTTHLFSEGLKELFTVEASEASPVLMEVDANIRTAFNAGSTNVLTLGDGAAVNTFLAAGDIDETATGFAAKKRVVLRARTVVKSNFAQSGTAATTGSAEFFFRLAGPGLP